MNQSGAFDQLFAPLGASLRAAADSVLDLRECAMNRTRPGRCVACYFAISGRLAAEEVMHRLCPLRQWLEEHIEVVASDASDSLLETVPLELAAPDLETLCTRLMREMRENRIHPGPVVNLEFRFKSGLQKVA